MAQYIDKSALVAEIKRRMKLRQDGYRKYNDVSDFVAFEELEYLHDEFLPTLEVKEVDLDREMQAFAFLYLEPLKISDSNIGISITMSQLYSCAKHFFELGLKVAQK